MRAQSTAGWFTFAVRVNGVEFHEAWEVKHAMREAAAQTC
jgi:hypothetical protein